jgi:hypothetical protein
MSCCWLAEDHVGRVATWISDASAKEASKRLRAVERELMRLNGRAPNLQLRKVTRRELEAVREKHRGKIVWVELNMEEELLS